MKTNETSPKKYNLNRKDIISEAYERCMKELYERAQPSADITEYYKKIKNGEITDDTRPYIYERHYISQAELKYIVEKYENAYRFVNEWIDNCDLLLSDMSKERTIDKYIEGHTDEYGNHHSGHRGYEHVPSMLEQFKKELGDEHGQKAYDMMKHFIEERRNFYRFDRDKETFDYNIYLGACPSTNKESVIEYWKSQGKDIEIEDRDPDTFWMIDEGYTKEEMEEELHFDDRTVIDDEEDKI